MNESIFIVLLMKETIPSSPVFSKSERARSERCERKNERISSVLLVQDRVARTHSGSYVCKISNNGLLQRKDEIRREVLNGDGLRFPFEESVGIPSVEPGGVRRLGLGLPDESFDLLLPLEFFGNREVLLDDGDEELKEND